MRSSEFRNYIFLFSLPLLFLAGLLLYKPGIMGLLRPEIRVLETIGSATGFTETVPPSPEKSSWGTEETYAAAVSFPVRIVAISFLFYTLVLLNIRNNPSQNRELFLWMSLYMLGIGVLLTGAPFFKAMNWGALLPALYFYLFFGFLFAYASRNLIVRE